MLTLYEEIIIELSFLSGEKSPFKQDLKWNIFWNFAWYFLNKMFIWLVFFFNKLSYPQETQMI